MLTIDSLKHKLSSTEDLQAIVQMMKTLAAASIQQCEHAVESLVQYNRTIEMGLQVVLESFSEFTLPDPPINGEIAIIVFGSDQGLCGSFNEQMATYAIAQLQNLSLAPQNPELIVVGRRVIAPLEAAGLSIADTFSMPSSIASITPIVQELLLRIESWYSHPSLSISKPNTKQVALYYQQLQSRTSHAPHTLRLLPIDRTWIDTVKQQKWRQRTLPTFTMDRSDLFAALIRQYLFVVIYRAVAESLASENASRLAAMQVAEQNIEERLADYQNQLQILRQTVITEEILEVLSGFEVLTQTQSASK